MSGQAFATKNTIIVKDSEGNFITIREKLPFGSRARLKGAIIGGLSQGEDGSTEMKMDLGRFQQVLLEEGIVSWGGDAFLNEDGKLKPVSKTAIADLDPEWPLVDDVLTELGQRNQIMGSSGGGSGGLIPNQPSTPPISSGSASDGYSPSMESSLEL